MKTRRRNRKVKRRSNRGAVLGVSGVVAVLLLALTFQSQKLVAENTAYAQQKEELEKQIADEEQRTKEIEELAEYMKTDEYVEEVAKSKLGLIYEDEIIFKPES